MAYVPWPHLHGASDRTALGDSFSSAREKGSRVTTKDAPSADDAAQSKSIAIDDNARVALSLLRQAFTCAQDAAADVWDFALEIGRLFDMGLTINALRWLVAKQFAEHGQESSVYGGPHRSFRRGEGFVFNKRTCVVLTTSGAAFVARFLKAPVASLQAVKPCWNSTRRELSLNGTVVKRFRVPAHNQELILTAFEEEGWPDHIHDPLPGGDIDPLTRLHDAINRLNGCQKQRLLRFSGNGMGTGVSWELRQSGVSH
jgi:hypothetical protein